MARDLGEEGDVTRDYFVKHVQLHPELKEIIKESVISNTDVRIEITDGKVPQFQPSG